MTGTYPNLGGNSFQQTYCHGYYLVVSNIIRIFMLTLQFMMGGKYKAGWSILAPLSVSHVM